MTTQVIVPLEELEPVVVPVVDVEDLAVVVVVVVVVADLAVVDVEVVVEDLAVVAVVAVVDVVDVVAVAVLGPARSAAFTNVPTVPKGVPLQSPMIEGNEQLLTNQAQAVQCMFLVCM